MRKSLVVFLLSAITLASFAQTDTIARIQPIKRASNDHFVIQLGTLNWQGKPDSIRTSGFPRTFNMYMMLDFPFKTNPHFSVAFGPGIATDHMFLDKMNARITDAASTVRFQDLSDTSHFKKFKVATAYLEAPLELRWVLNPDRNARSVKAAIGGKLGTLLSAWSKGKNLQDKNGNVINTYIDKEKSKRFFNSTRISATGRVGYGNFTLFGSYALTPLFKEGQGPKINPVSIGLTLSGL